MTQYTFSAHTTLVAIFLDSGKRGPMHGTVASCQLLSSSVHAFGLYFNHILVISVACLLCT